MRDVFDQFCLVNSFISYVFGDSDGKGVESGVFPEMRDVMNPDFQLNQCRHDL